MSCHIKRILQFNDLVSAGPIQLFNNDGVDITRSCAYSWSTDSVCWTNWVNYDNYLRLSKNIEEDVYIRVLITDSLLKVSINGVYTKCYSICIASTNMFEESLCGNENQFSPYSGLDCALQLQQQLADGVVCTFGIPIFYFRVEPDKTTIDYTFKEYILHDVVSIKQLKLVVPDGTMPSSNPKFSALDFDWQVDWDVEIGKTEFTTAFGEGIVPKARDFIYIPMMKRMWKVNTAYDEKNEGLMWQSTTWKLSLIKYEDSDNVAIPDEMDNIIDSWITRYDNTLGNKEKIEQERLSGSSQVLSPLPSPTNLCNIMLSDAVRRSYTKGEVNVVACQLNHKNNVVARNIYKFKSNDAAVYYQQQYCGGGGTLCFIIQTPSTVIENHQIITIGPLNIEISSSDGGYTLTCGELVGQLGKDSTYMVITRWCRSNYTLSMDCYKHTHPDNIAKYLLRPEMYYFDSSPTFSVTTSYNNDLYEENGCDCVISPGSCGLTNIKLYDRDLGLEESIKESFKYTTTHKGCVINDVARPLLTNHGYSVK